MNQQIFDGYLCQAWGETELPCAEIVKDMDGVRAFMIREWLGDVPVFDVETVMQDISSHNYKDEGEWHAAFEIGGVSVKPVYSFSCHQKPLTLEKIRKCWESVQGTRNGYTPFARSIEFEHGIKDQT